jgi:hypothetical protein
MLPPVDPDDNAQMHVMPSRNRFVPGNQTKKPDIREYRDPSKMIWDRFMIAFSHPG